LQALDRLCNMLVLPEIMQKAPWHGDAESERKWKWAARLTSDFLQAQAQHIQRDLIKGDMVLHVVHYLSRGPAPFAMSGLAADRSDRQQARVQHAHYPEFDSADEETLMMIMLRFPHF